MSSMTPEQARAYLERWDLVRDAEATVLRTTSMAIKFRQLESLMTSRGEFWHDPLRERDVELVRQRWTALRKALGA
jgi:hypothetical protein